MSYQRFQFTAVDRKGNAMPGAVVEIRKESDGSIAAIYADGSGTVLGNPFAADSDGYAAFHAEEGEYKVTTRRGGAYRVWRNVLVSRDPSEIPRFKTIVPETYGAVGNNSTVDDAALVLWIAALKAESAANGTAYGILSRKYKTSATLTLQSWSGTIHIAGVGGDAGLYPSGSGVTGLAVSGGAASSTTTISASAVFAARTIDLTSAASFAIGDYITISNNTGYSTDTREMLNRIVNKSGNTITLEIPLAFAIDSGQTTLVTKQTMTEGIILENFVIDGTNATGSSIGLNADRIIKPTIRNLRIKNFSTASATGAYVLRSWAPSIDSVTLTACGNAPGSDAIVLQDLSNGFATNIIADKANGFGIGINFCAGMNFSGLSANYAAGRGIKLSGACGNNFSNCHASNAGSGYVGFGLSSGSANNNFSNIVTNGTPGGSSVGLWLNGTGNINNRFVNITAKGNVTDIFSTATAPLNDSGNVFINVNSDAVMSLYSDNVTLRASGAAFAAISAVALNVTGTTGVATGIGLVAANTLGFYIAGTAAVRMSSSGLQMGSIASQAGALVSARDSTAGVEWGHQNSGGYLCVLGNESGSGAPFMAWNCYAGTTGNTYQTLGIPGIVFRSGLDGSVSINAVVTASANNQALTQLVDIRQDGFKLATGVPLKYNGTQVVSARRTGWGAPTGTATRTAFATGSVTTAALAEAVKALIDDLTTHGLIGA